MGRKTTKWQPKEAAWRAARTFLQTFAGALTGITVVFNPALLAVIGAAAFSSAVAALYAFAMNLEAESG